MSDVKRHMGKTDNIVLSSSICYNADTSCFTPVVLFDMRSTSLGSNLQIKYEMKDDTRKTKRMAL